MWICLPDAFLSIVSKDCAPDELLVRARRPGDIERLWPEAVAREGGGTDYRFRAAIPRAEVAAAIADALTGIDDGNFTDAVGDPGLHDASLDAWHALARVEPYGRPSLAPSAAGCPRAAGHHPPAARAERASYVGGP